MPPIGVVVEKGVALADIALVILAHVRALQMRAEDMHRQPFGGRQKLVVARDDAAREVARRRDHRRRAARSSVFVISRTMPSSRFAITVSTIGASVSEFDFPFMSAGAASDGVPIDLESAGGVTPTRRPVDHDRRGRLLDDRRPGDRVARL